MLNPLSSSLLPTDRPNLLSCHEPDEQHILPLGQMVIVLDDPDFRNGYEEGRCQYERWHQQDRVMDAGLLLALVRNGWGGSSHSEIWQTGYIVGWLCTLFAYAHGLEGVI